MEHSIIHIESIPYLDLTYLSVLYSTASRKPCWKQSLAAIASWSRDLSYSRKLSQISAVLWLYAKVFSTKFGAWHPLVWQKQAIRESFSTKIIFFTNLRKFSPSKVFRYAVVPEQYIVVVWQSLPKKKRKEIPHFNMMINQTLNIVVGLGTRLVVWIWPS